MRRIELVEMKFLIIFLIIPHFLFSFDKMIHLHLDNLNSFYKTSSKNKIFENIYNSSDWNNFKTSKLYMRLLDDIKAIDPSSKILNFKNFEKLPSASFDFYLINIEEEKFVSKIKLEKSQSTALLNVNLNKLPKISFQEKTIYNYQKLHIVIEKDFLFISNDLSSLTSYFKDSSDFNSNLKLDTKYRNFLYINIKKINKTPYLKNYWFTRLKEFSNIDTVKIQFNLNQKSFEEKGVLILKKDIKSSSNLKVVDNKFKITLFNRKGNFQIAPFTNQKDIKIYSMVSDDFKNKAYIANYIGTKNFNDFLKGITVSAKLTEGDILKYHYGLMNRKLIYIKLIEKTVLMSNNLKLLKKIKLKDESKLQKLITISDFKNISDTIYKISKLDKNNYSYNNFLESYLGNYIKINSFDFKLINKNNKELEFNTKIIF